MPHLTQVTNWETKMESIISCHQDETDHQGEMHKKPATKTTRIPEENQESVMGPDTTENPEPINLGIIDDQDQIFYNAISIMVDTDFIQHYTKHKGVTGTSNNFLVKALNMRICIK
jgi:hypothetical protein